MCATESSLMNKFSFDLVGDGEAKTFWEDSPHASVFTNPAVLSRLGSHVDWWVARKKGEPLCLWPVCRPDGATVGLPEFSYYVGPMWSQKGSKTPAHRWLAESTRVYEGLIHLFIERYGAMHAELPPGVTDVRVFDWWNYHEPKKPRFSIRARYTACIRGLQARNIDEIAADFRFVRRYEIRQAVKCGLPARTAEWTLLDLSFLYSEVMGRQDLTVSDTTKREIAVLVDLVADGMGEVIAFRDSESGELTSMVLLLQDKGVANMVLNLTANRWRGSGIAAWTVYHAIQAAQARGADVFDFNGANSPDRGDDKHSYGAAPELFFEVRYPG